MQKERILEVVDALPDDVDVDTLMPVGSSLFQAVAYRAEILTRRREGAEKLNQHERFSLVSAPLRLCVSFQSVFAHCRDPFVAGGKKPAKGKR